MYSCASLEFALLVRKYSLTSTPLPHTISREDCLIPLVMGCCWRVALVCGMLEDVNMSRGLKCVVQLGDHHEKSMG